MKFFISLGVFGLALLSHWFLTSVLSFPSPQALAWIILWLLCVNNATRNTGGFG